MNETLPPAPTRRPPRWLLPLAVVMVLGAGILIPGGHLVVKLVSERKRKAAAAAAAAANNEPTDRS